MRVLGIDPGLNGGAAVYDTDRPAAVHVTTLPTTGVDTHRIIDVRSLAAWIEEVMPFGERKLGYHSYIEHVTAMKGWGAGSSFRFGGAFFSLRATVTLCGINYVLVVPMKWKKHFHIWIPKDKRVHPDGEPMTQGQVSTVVKRMARRKAAALFPETASKFEMAKDDGIAEAALIARYGADMTRGLL